MPKSPFLQNTYTIILTGCRFGAGRNARLNRNGQAFGSGMAARTASFGATYKYGFNNQEKEGELGEYYSFEYRVHDARLGRFLSVDPLAPEYPWNSTYAFAENQVIWAVRRLR